MRKVVFVALAGLIFLGTLLSLQSTGAAPSYASGLGLDTETPTATASVTATATSTPSPTVTQTPTPPGPIRFPIISRDPTRTPTATSTATVTPTITRTPTKTATGAPGATGLSGQLARTEPSKPSYATFIENVWLYESIFNPTGQTINFGILGLTTKRPDNSDMPFKTSWDGAGAPGGVLQIFAGCHGPAGNPCAGSSDAGRHVDHVGDNGGNEHTPWEVTQVGTYQVRFYVCYSTYSACQNPGGNWQLLSGPVTFNAINWTPTPSINQVQGATATPDNRADFTGPQCYLITDNPAGIYLSCARPQSQHRVAPRHP